MDSLYGQEGGHISCPPRLRPEVPRHRSARPAVPGGIAAFPLSCLCVTELRVRFLGTRTKIHAADTPEFAFAPPSEHTRIPSVHHTLIRGFSFRGHMSRILVTRIHQLNAGKALELPSGAVPSYVSYPPTSQPRTQRLPLASQKKGQFGWDLIRSPAPSQDP